MNTEQLHQVIPFSKVLGIQLVEAAPERVVLTMDWRPDLCTSVEIMHGGALMSLADNAGALIAVLNLPEGSTGTTTLESKTNLLRAVKAGTVTATASALHTGRSVIVVETVLTCDGRTVAKTTQTQMVLRAA